MSLKHTENVKSTEEIKEIIFFVYEIFSTSSVIALPLPQYLLSTLEPCFPSGADILVLHSTVICAESLNHFVALGQK